MDMAAGTDTMQSVVKMTEKITDNLREDTKLAEMFCRCYSNTLNKTVEPMADGTTFVITGDIPAMWLRDSVCQLRPYLILAEFDSYIADLIEGLVKRQFRYIQIDPYANAFNREANNQGHQDDETDRNPIVWERKYEIDSLCFPIQLSYLFWKNTGRTSHFTKEWTEGIRTVIKLFRTEQNHEKNSPYRFQRKNCVYTDTLSRDGRGALVKGDTGLIWSGFRPSDDACVYGYLIPSNMFAVVALKYVAEIAETVLMDELFAKEAAKFAAEVEAAIENYGTLEHSKYGRVYAYEVDGYGQYLLMDDANVPSLLSIPYLGYVTEENQVYQNTRAMILSDTNPFYFSGKKLRGIGSPHTPERYVWHIALAVEGLTVKDQGEKLRILELLRDTDGGTGMMHEGVDVDDPGQYSREWFSWANAMFCELLLEYCGFKVRT